VHSPRVVADRIVGIVLAQHFAKQTPYESLRAMTRNQGSSSPAMNHYEELVKVSVSGHLTLTSRNIYSRPIRIDLPGPEHYRSPSSISLDSFGRNISEPTISWVQIPPPVVLAVCVNGNCRLLSAIATSTFRLSCSYYVRHYSWSRFPFVICESP
jgi:hypothetical protein